MYLYVPLAPFFACLSAMQSNDTLCTFVQLQVPVLVFRMIRCEHFPESTEKDAPPLLFSFLRETGETIGGAGAEMRLLTCLLQAAVCAQCILAFNAPMSIAQRGLGAAMLLGNRKQICNSGGQRISLSSFVGLQRPCRISASMFYDDAPCTCTPRNNGTRECFILIF